LWRDANLAIAALALASGRDLPAALEDAGYAAASAKSFHITGPGGDSRIRRALNQSPYCEQVTDPRYTDVNSLQRGDETWIVLAAPLFPTDQLTVAARILDLVNAARTQARSCGDERHEAAMPVTLSTLLTEAALAHAGDIAARENLSLIGADGSTAGERYTRAGYAWSVSGQNVAMGQRHANAVVAAWLADPVSCATLMGPYYTEMGVAFAFAAPGSNPGIYWVQAFAAPR
jgi:uncharacterized protein YkwD